MGETMKVLILIALLVTSSMAHSHPGFVSITDLCPEVKAYMNYATTENFTGEVVAGYKARKAFMAKAPAEALCKVIVDAKRIGLGIKIFDCYRPAKAVAFFQEWAKKPETDPERKEFYYPEYTREQLFELGYIATKSSHSKGSAIDLTLFDLESGKDLDMGTHFDYFGELSHTDNLQVTAAQRKNRYLLKELMEGRGFKNFSQEWWHYSMKPEPYPDTYFDFDVE
jgi:D-alanyl-D-alanine dipeptidase